MALSSELLKILVCPETRQSLRLAGQGVVDDFNRKIEEGVIYTRSKKKLELAVSDLLIREDSEMLYQVRDQIPILLIEEAVETSLVGNIDLK